MTGTARVILTLPNVIIIGIILDEQIIGAGANVVDDFTLAAGTLPKGGTFISCSIGNSVNSFQGATTISIVDTTNGSFTYGQNVVNVRVVRINNSGVGVEFGGNVELMLRVR